MRKQLLNSCRILTYVKPRIGENRFGGESVTYEGVDTTKKWERIESYSPKFVENIVQAISRDILMYTLKTLSHCYIVGHVHDEVIIEASMDTSLPSVLIYYQYQHQSFKPTYRAWDSSFSFQQTSYAPLQLNHNI